MTDEEEGLMRAFCDLVFYTVACFAAVAGVVWLVRCVA